MKLIKTLEEVLEFIPVPMNTEIDVMKPYFSMAERSLGLLIGKEQLLQLIEKYEDPDAEAVFKEAISHAQRVIVNQGYFFAIPILSVNISSAGILINGGENTKQAFGWQVEKVEKSLLELSFSAIEVLLEFLEEHADQFPKYIESDEYKKQQRFFIQTAAEFSQFFEIANSRYLYSTISYLIKRVEDQDLVQAFNAKFIKELRESTSEVSKELLNDFIKPGIALISAAKALKERVIISRNGVATINLSGNYNAIQKDLPEDKQQTQIAYDQLLESGLKYFADGMGFVLENSTSFPEFQQSQNHKKNYNIKNDRTKGVWAN